MVLVSRTDLISLPSCLGSLEMIYQVLPIHGCVGAAELLSFQLSPVSQDSSKITKLTLLLMDLSALILAVQMGGGGLGSHYLGALQLGVCDMVVTDGCLSAIYKDESTFLGAKERLAFFSRRSLDPRW